MLGVETEQENDGRWIAELPEYPGLMSYGPTELQAIFNVMALYRKDFVLNGAD